MNIHVMQIVLYNAAGLYASPVASDPGAKPVQRSLFASPGSDVSAGESSPAVKASLACIGPLCSNEGLDDYKGLCAACHDVLVAANSPQSQPTSVDGALWPLVLTLSSLVTNVHSEDEDLRIGREVRREGAHPR